MADQQYDILISAYLDDELTAQERARVEQLLASNAEARQLADELRALRASLQEMPQHRLDPEFAARVLVQAQRQPEAVKPMETSSSAPPVVTLPVRQTPDAPIPIRPTVFRTWRGIAWAAVAVAAALVVLVTNRPADDGRNVALAPQRQQQAAEKSAVGQTAASESIAAMRNEPEAVIKTEGAGGFGQPAPSDIANRSAPAPGMPMENLRGNAATPTLEFDRDLARAVDQQSGQRAIAPGRDQPVVIRVDVTVEAAQRREFDQLLVRHQLVASESRAPPSGSFDEKLSKDLAAESLTELEIESKRKSVDDRLAEPGAARVVYVDAPREQIEAALADLDASPQSFPAVDVATAGPIPRQRESGSTELRRSKGLSLRTDTSGTQPGPSSAATPPTASYRLAPADRLDRAQSKPAPNEADQRQSGEVTTPRLESSLRSLNDLSVPSGASPSHARSKELPAVPSAPAAGPAPPTPTAAAPALSAGGQGGGGALGGAPGSADNRFAVAPRMQAVFVLRIVDETKPAEKSTPGGEK